MRVLEPGKAIPIPYYYREPVVCRWCGALVQLEPGDIIETVSSAIVYECGFCRNLSYALKGKTDR